MQQNAVKINFFGSLRVRLSLTISGIIAVITILFTLFFLNEVRRFELAQLQIIGEIYAKSLATAVITPLYAGNNEEVAHLVSEMHQYESIAAIRVSDSQEEYIAATSIKIPSENQLVVTIPVKAPSSMQTAESTITGEINYAVNLGRVEIVLDRANINNSLHKTIKLAFIVALLFWLISTTLSYAVFGKIIKSFNLLMKGVGRIEEGHLDEVITVASNDESGQALAAINRLAETLRIKNIENERLQAEVVAGLRLKLDEEKEKHMAKLIQTNRMTSLGLLVSSMAHEINNPNGAIRLGSEIIESLMREIIPLLRNLAESEGEYSICGMPYDKALDDIERALESISSSSVRIERVVYNLRSYSLGEKSGDYINYQVNRVIENALAIVKAHGKIEGIGFTSDLSPALPPTSGNPFQVEQVLTNLLLNAIQAKKSSEMSYITITTAQNAAGIIITVKDTHGGINENSLPYIFEPFFSTKINMGGSGLGLYIAKFLIEEQGGSLNISNNSEGGCSAVLTLPLA